MYIYQNGKLYLREKDHLVGVEIYPDKVTKLFGTETPFDTDFEVIFSYDVCDKFGITNDNPYIFPVEQKEVNDEPVVDIQKPSRGRPKRK